MADGTSWWPSGQQAAQQIEIGHHFMLARRFDRAAQCFRAAIRFEPENPDAYGRLAIALSESRNLEEAERVAEYALGQWPNLSPILQVGATVRHLRGQWQQAVELLERAIALSPETYVLHTYLGSILIEQGLHSEAEVPLRRALQLQPEDWGTLLQFAIVLIEQSKWQEARSALDNALQQAPQESMTQTVAGYYLLQTNESESAAVHLREALRIDPDNRYAQHWLQAAMARQEQPQPASPL